MSYFRELPNIAYQSPLSHKLDNLEVATGGVYL